MTKRLALTPALETFVSEMVASGRYGSASEVIAEGLHLLRDREKTARSEQDQLRQAWHEGMDSGEPVDADGVFDRLIAKYDSLGKAERA